MKNKYILILLLILSGCKYPFELDQKDVQSVAAIRSYICADSLVSIDINKTIPLTQLVTADTTLINPHYSLKCNGTEIYCEESMIGEGRLLLQTDAFKCGDKIELVFV